MPWTVSRQLQFPNGKHVVEISQGGIDFCNPDFLAVKYPRELQEYRDPRDAVEAAISIAQAWQADVPGEKILVDYGATRGATVPFDGMALCDATFWELRGWAKAVYEKLPKCSQCGEILSEKDWYVNPDLLWGEEFCSERCLEVAMEAVREEEEEPLDDEGEDYSDLSEGEFDQILVEILRELTPEQILSYGEVYIFFSEEFNNEVLDRWKAKRKEGMITGQNICSVCGKEIDPDDVYEIEPIVYSSPHAEHPNVVLYFCGEPCYDEKTELFDFCMRCDRDILRSYDNLQEQHFEYDKNGDSICKRCWTEADEKVKREEKSE